jgi:hypothetical protein
MSKFEIIPSEKDFNFGVDVSPAVREMREIASPRSSSIRGRSLTVQEQIKSHCNSIDRYLQARENSARVHQTLFNAMCNSDEQ